MDGSDDGESDPAPGAAFSTVDSDQEPAIPGRDSGAGGAHRRPGRRPGRRSGWRRFLRYAAGVVTLGLLTVIAIVGIAYNRIELPRIPPTAQATTVTYKDGTRPVAVFASENRKNVRIGVVPRAAQNAVVAAEDASFWANNEGVSATGIGRALVGLVKGDRSAGGGSTITQQYIRNAFDLTRDRSYARKGKEVILARKLARSKSKKSILEGYLNTIYFGRRAFGIQAAAAAYFGVDAKNLTVAQGAVLAAAIKDPTNFDPRIKPDSARRRWNYVLDQMVRSGFLGSGERRSVAYPATLPRETVASQNKSLRSGWQGVLGARVERELSGILSERQIYTGGYTVTTTLDHALQMQAASAARAALVGRDTRMAAAMAAVVPKTGAVRVYYGGEAGFGNFDPIASPHPAGASFKPYVMAAMLTEGTKPPLPGPDNLGVYLNSVHVDLRAVARLARNAGIGTLGGLDPLARKALVRLAAGQPAVTVLDQAAGYATLADDGIAHEPYLIEKVTDANGTLIWQHKPHQNSATRAVELDAVKVTRFFMQQFPFVLPPVPLKRSWLRGARELVGQAGIADGHTDAWMCGFSGALAAAVWVGGTSGAVTLRHPAESKLDDGQIIPASVFLDVMTSGSDK